VKIRTVVLAALTVLGLGLVALSSPDATAAAAAAIFRPDAGTFFTSPALPNYRESLAAVQIPGTETLPTTKTDGFEVKNANPYDLFVEVSTSPTSVANDAGTCATSTSGDKDANTGFAANTVPTMWLYAYAYNPATGVWNRAPDNDVKTAGGSTTWSKLGITPPSGVSRIAYIHSTTGSACPLRIYVVSRP
jgi:hypothetical protein